METSLSAKHLAEEKMIDSLQAVSLTEGIGEQAVV
jgi:hypothetical protein